MNAWIVLCRSEYTYAQEPRALVYAGVEYPIAQILARWRTPAGPGFRVRSALGEHTLAYDESADVWTVTPALPLDADARGE